MRFWSIASCALFLPLFSSASLSTHADELKQGPFQSCPNLKLKIDTLRDWVRS